MFNFTRNQTDLQSILVEVSVRDHSVARVFSATGVFFSSGLSLYNSISLVRSNLGFLRIFTFFDHAAVFLKWEDFGAAIFLNLFANIALEQNADEIFEAVFLNSGGHDFHHLLSDLLLLGCLSIASGLDLSWGLLGESNSEHSHNIAIGSLGLHE